jgi:hypothetical protein
MVIVSAPIFTVVEVSALKAIKVELILLNGVAAVPLEHDIFTGAFFV